MGLPDTSKPTRRRRFARFGSPDSVEANYGSDPENDRIEEAEMREVEEVDEWLTQPIPPTPTFAKEDEKPFRIYNTPGALLYQLLFYFFLYLNLVPPPPPPCPANAMILPRKSVPRPNHRRVDLGILFGRRREPVNDDATEYVISPRPGTNQLPIHINVTTNNTTEKLKLHNKGMLRIYRIPRHTVERMRFAMDVSRFGLCGDVARMPVDEEDIVAVYRHGYRVWDFFQKDEVWYLVATNPHVLRQVLARCEYLQPPLSVRIKKPIWWAIRRILSSFLPFVCPPGRPIDRPQRIPIGDDNILPKPWYDDNVVISSDSDSDSDSDTSSYTGDGEE